MIIISRLNCIDAESGIVTLIQWTPGAQVESALNLCIERPVTENDDTRCCINTIKPPGDGHIMFETY
jgi:hypothetical protein